MGRISTEDLHTRTTEILHRLRDTGEAIEITEAGTVVARLVPPPTAEPGQFNLDEFWAEWDRLSREIGDSWPTGTSALDSVREQRREL